MIADWDIPARSSTPDGDSVQVVAIVPLPSDLGGKGELLVASAFGIARLPAGDVRPRETGAQAARRVVLGAAGVEVTPERLLYVLERHDEPLTLCFLCTLADSEPDPKPGVAFARVDADDVTLDPSGIHETLREDLRNGFARGIGHIVIDFDSEGRERRRATW